MVAEQVAAHISEEDIFKLAPIHAEMIRVTGIKRREIKEKGESSPTTPLLLKKMKKIKEEVLREGGEKTLGNVAALGKPSITTNERLQKDHQES